MSTDLLRAGFGVSYTSIGYVQPALDHRYLVLDIELPHYVRSRLHNLTMNCDYLDGSAATKVICDDFRTMIDRYTRFNEIKDGEIQLEIQRILDLMPTDKYTDTMTDQTDKAPTKQKRAFFIPMAFGIASGIMNIVNTVNMRRKIGILKESVEILEQNQFKLHDNFVQLHGEFANIVQLTAENFEVMHNAINNTNARLTRLTANMRQDLLSILNAMQNREQAVDYTFQVLTRYLKLTLQYISQTDKHYNNMQWYLQGYRDGMIQLMQGKMPPSLVPPHKLKEILLQATKALYAVNPNYELVFSSVAHYYRKTDVLYTYKNGHFLVTVPLLLKKVNQRPMELYRIEQCFVPYTVQNGTGDDANSYTKVKIDTEFIAVGGHNFAEMSYAQLAACTEYNDLYLCQRHILQVHESSLTCASAIFFGTNPVDVNKHCEFEYRHLIKPAPCTLEADEYVLLTNLGREWSFRCTDDNLPQRIVGSNFAVIHKDNFCLCALVGKDYFIPQRLEDCENRPDQIELLFPINAAVATVFYKEIGNEALLKDLSKLYASPQNLNIPKLNLTLSDHDPEVLVENDLTQIIDLKKLAKAINSKGKVYLNKQDKNKHHQKFQNWFDSAETVSLSITFVLACAGMLACLLGIYNCIRGHKIMALFGALTTKIGGAEALEFSADCVGTQYSDTIVDRIIQVIIVVTIICLYHLLKYFYQNSTITRIIMPSSVAGQRGDITHVQLEIGNSQTGTIRTYLCSIHAPIMGLELCGYLRKGEISLEIATFWTHGIMELGRTLAGFKIKHEGHTVILPTMAYVPVWSYKTMKTILDEPNTVQLLLTYKGLTYVLPGSSIDKGRMHTDIWCSDQTNERQTNLRLIDTTDPINPTVNIEDMEINDNVIISVPNVQVHNTAEIIPPMYPTRTRLQC